MSRSALYSSNWDCGIWEKDVNSKKHEPITFMAPYMDVDSFIKEVHKTYPEVNLKVVPYSGANTTVYLNTIMEENDLPDICTLTLYDRNSRASVTRCLIFQDMLLRIIM